MTSRRHGGPAARTACWAVVSVAVLVASAGLPWLRRLAPELLGTRGGLMVFLLGAALGVGGLVFAVRARRACRRGAHHTAAEHRVLARRWSVSGVAFVVGLCLLAAAAHLVRPVAGG